MSTPTPPLRAPTSSPSVSPIADGAQGNGVFDYWPIAVAATVALALALGWVMLRRRAARLETFDPVDDDVVEEVATPPTPAGLLPRGQLALTFRPIRAGLNLLSATSENEIVITNIGDAPAENIHVLARLVSAHTGQDAELSALYAAPIGRPAVPAFALQPGEQRVLNTVAALPRDAIRTLTAGGRPMFVPIVAVNLTYATDGIDRQLAQAFAIGIERVDSSKLAPFWLDAPPRTFDQVAARPHAAPLER